MEESDLKYRLHLHMQFTISTAETEMQQKNGSPRKTRRKGPIAAEGKYLSKACMGGYPRLQAAS